MLEKIECEGVGDNDGFYECGRKRPYNQRKVKEAFETIKQAMKDDCPSERGSFAHTWHCNIAMCCSDAITNDPFGTMGQGEAQVVGNDAATSFMLMCFDVGTKQ